MGVQLTLLITKGNDWLAHDMLELPYDEQLYNDLQMLSKTKGRDCPRNGISCHVARDKNGETAYGQLTEDCYGEPMKNVLVSDLNQVFSKAIIDENDWLTKSVIALFSHYPAHILVYLYWH